jgi:hypothetical protein
MTLSDTNSPSNEAFLIGMFPTCMPDEAPWVTGFPGDPALTAPQNWGGRPIVRGIPWFIRPDHNNYVCVSMFRREQDGAWHRRKANFTAMHAVMVDDIGTKVPADKLVLEPSVMVETSPDNFQAWYFLDPPEVDPIRADLILKRMIAAGLTADAKDPGMRGVTRYGRLPIGINGKAIYVERLGSAFLQQVKVWKPDRRTSLEVIAGAYGLSLEPEPSVTFRPRSAADALASLIPRLEQYGLYLSELPGQLGGHRIVCPWLHDHTGKDPSGTVYFEPSPSNDWQGGFKCHHGHCTDRGIRDLQNFIRAAERIIKKGKAA